MGEEGRPGKRSLSGDDPQAGLAPLQGLQAVLHLLRPVGVVQDQLLQGAARLLQAPQQLQDARVAHTVVAQVQLSQAAVGQQERGEAAAAAVGHLTVPKTEHPQCGTRLAQGLAQLLDARVTQLVAAQLKFQEMLVLGQHQADVLAAGRREAAGLHPQGLQLAAGLQQALAQQPGALVAQLVARQTQFLQGLLGLEDTAEVSAATGGDVTLPEPQGLEAGGGAQEPGAQLGYARVAQPVAAQVKLPQRGLGGHNSAQVFAVGWRETAVLQPERLQLAGRVCQTLAQHPGAGLADVVVAHRELLQGPRGPEHRGQGLAAGGRQAAVLQLQLLQVALGVQEPLTEQPQAGVPQWVVAEMQLPQRGQGAQRAGQDPAARLGQGAVLQAELLDLAGGALQALQHQMHAGVAQLVGPQAQLGQAGVGPQGAADVLAMLLGQAAVVEPHHLVLLQQGQQLGPPGVAQLLAMDVQVHM